MIHLNPAISAVCKDAEDFIKKIDCTLVFGSEMTPHVEAMLIVAMRHEREVIDELFPC